MKLPKINDLVLWDNRFSIVKELLDDCVICRGIGNEKIIINNKDFIFGQVATDIYTAPLYDFEEAIGENVYDPLGHVRNCRVLETAKGIGDLPRTVYLVTLHDYEAHTIVVRAVRRYGDNHLYWAKA